MLRSRPAYYENSNTSFYHVSLNIVKKRAEYVRQEKTEDTSIKKTKRSPWTRGSIVQTYPANTIMYTLKSSKCKYDSTTEYLYTKPRDIIDYTSTVVIETRH